MHEGNSFGLVGFSLDHFAMSSIVLNDDLPMFKSYRLGFKEFLSLTLWCLATLLNIPGKKVVR